MKRLLKPTKVIKKYIDILVNVDDYDDAEAYVDRILDRIESKYTDR